MDVVDLCAHLCYFKWPKVLNLLKKLLRHLLLLHQWHSLIHVARFVLNVSP